MSTAEPVYLDYNATAPLRPEAAEAMMEAVSYTHLTLPTSTLV